MIHTFPLFDHCERIFISLEEPGEWHILGQVIRNASFLFASLRDCNINNIKEFLGESAFFGHPEDYEYVRIFLILHPIIYNNNYDQVKKYEMDKIKERKICVSIKSIFIFLSAWCQPIIINRMYKRIQKEFDDIQKNPPEGCWAKPLDGDLYHW